MPKLLAETHGEFERCTLWRLLGVRSAACNNTLAQEVEYAQVCRCVTKMISSSALANFATLEPKLARA
jgi:hypothetical protein